MSLSAIIPVKDGASFIVGALDSLCAQGDLVSEILVVNNGSTDATPDIVTSYPDTRVRLINSDIPNLPLSRNIGAETAQSDWLYFLDADDRVFPGALAKLLAVALASSRKVSVVYGDYCRLAENGRKIGARSFLPKSRKPTGDVLDAFLTGNKMIVGAQIVRTGHFREVGGFNPDIPFAEDWELWCRLASQALFEFVPDLTVLGYTMHTASMSHHATIKLSKFDPVLKAIFSNPQIAVRSDAAYMRRRAVAGCLTYICTEAVRIGAHRDAGMAFAQAIARDPKRTLLIAAKYAGAYLSL